MAISIDTVYQQVLAIANKEQRGYITPQEFNLFARKAQIDIFDSYMYNYAKAIATPNPSHDIADDIEIIKDKIAPFKVIESNIATDGTLSDGSSVHWIDSVYDVGTQRQVEITFPARSNFSDDGGSSITLRAIYEGDGTKDKGEGAYSVLFNTTGAPSGNDSHYTAGTIYVNLPSDQSTAAQVATRFVERINDASPYHAASIKTNTEATVVLTYLQRGIMGHVGTFESFINITGLTSATVVNTSNSDNNIVFEEVDSKDLFYMKSALKLKPTNNRPVYYRKNASSIVTYPSISNPILCDYIKKPVNPKWGYVVINNKALYNSNESIDFELHASEESTLVNKIVELAGITISRPDLSQAILQNEQVKEALKNK